MNKMERRCQATLYGYVLINKKILGVMTWSAEIIILLHDICHLF